MNDVKKPSVPLLDFAVLTGQKGRSEELAKLDAACRNTGFFYLINHGISQATISAVMRQAAWFFALPSEVKITIARNEANSRGYYNQELTKNVRDMKEVFDFGHLPSPDLSESDPVNRTRDGWNQWPVAEGHDDFKSGLSLYYTYCGRVANGVLRALTQNLGADSETLTGDFHPHHTSFLRLNYYPVNDPLTGRTGDVKSSASTGHMGVHHHTDAGALTLLLQDSVGGLEIYSEDEWIPVDPVAGALVVNIGDIVQVWSNDQYMAPLHRVVASSKKDRFSIPYFFNPLYESNYAPLPEAVFPGESAHYKEINWGHFRNERQHGDYGNYGDEIQISDYQV